MHGHHKKRFFQGMGELYQLNRSLIVNSEKFFITHEIGQRISSELAHCQDRHRGLFGFSRNIEDPNNGGFV